MEGYDVKFGDEYEPGHFRTTRVPDASYVTEVMEAAADTLQWTTWKWLTLSGYGAQARLFAGMNTIHERMPNKN